MSGRRGRMSFSTMGNSLKKNRPYRSPSSSGRMYGSAAIPRSAMESGPVSRPARARTAAPRAAAAGPFAAPCGRRPRRSVPLAPRPARGDPEAIRRFPPDRCDATRRRAGPPPPPRRRRPPGRGPGRVGRPGEAGSAAGRAPAELGPAPRKGALKPPGANGRGMPADDARHRPQAIRGRDGGAGAGRGRQRRRCHEHAAAPAGHQPSRSESPATLTAATDPLPVRRAAARGAARARAAARGAARPGAGVRAAARAGAPAAAGAGTRPARPPRCPLRNIVAGVILLIHFWR